MKRTFVAAISAGALIAVIAFAANRKPSASPVSAQSSPESGLSIRGVSLEERRALGSSNEEVAAYSFAARKFPSIENCLDRDPVKASSLTIDWYKIDSNVEAEVCLSRVARKLGSPRKMVAWLKAHKFIVYRVSNADSYAYFDLNMNQLAGTVIDAGWSISENGALQRGGLTQLSQVAFGHGVSVQFFLREHSDIISVGVGTTYL